MKTELERIRDQLKCSLNMGSLKGSAEWTVGELDRLLGSLPAAPEFCCALSYKAAKQAAWGALDLTQCKCDHNEYCEHCWPVDFREGGKWYGGFETKRSAPDRVSVPVELVRKLVRTYESAVIDAAHWTDMDGEVTQLRALLAAHRQAHRND